MKYLNKLIGEQIKIMWTAIRSTLGQYNYSGLRRGALNT